MWGEEMQASVKTLVHKLESGGPDAGPPAQSHGASGPPAQPHGSSQPHGPVSRRAEGRLAECAPGVHVTVLRGRDFAAHADVGSYVCLSTMSNDSNVAELAIGAPARRPLLLPLCCSALLWSRKASPLVAPATHGLCVQAADHNTNKAKSQTFYCKDRETLFILPAFRTRVVKEWPHPTFAASTVFKEVARPTQQFHPLFLAQPARR